MNVTAVADAGPLIHLAEISSLELLDVLDRLFVPETVHEELAAGGVPDGLSELSHELVTADQSSETDVELDPGETAALTVASERDAVLLTDDMAARDRRPGSASRYTGPSASSPWRTLAVVWTGTRPPNGCERSSERPVYSSPMRSSNGGSISSNENSERGGRERLVVRRCRSDAYVAFVEDPEGYTLEFVEAA